MAQSRAPLTAWISPLETGNPARRCPIAGEAPTCALDESAGIVYCTDGTNGSGFFSYDIATDTWTTLASIPQSDTTVLHQVPSMARCSSRVGAVVFSTLCGCMI